jgi:hypothetical protein
MQLPVFSLAALLIAALMLCVMILRWGMPQNRGLAIAFSVGAWAAPT